MPRISLCRGSRVRQLDGLVPWRAGTLALECADMSALWNEIEPWRDRLGKNAATRRRTRNLARDRNGDRASWLQREL
jgi:hypothetical protein